jgi:hypothetical protein
MTNDKTSGDSFDPNHFLAEFEGHLRELEAAGGQAPEVLKQQLERMKRLLAEGAGQGIGFMQAGDESSGLMGLSIPLDEASDPRDSEEGAT